jgi:hypothetical protein
MAPRCECKSPSVYVSVEIVGDLDPETEQASANVSMNVSINLVCPLCGVKFRNLATDEDGLQADDKP